MAGVRLAPRWRFSPSWSLGLLVRVSGEGRFHLLPEGESTAAFGILEVGFAIAQDRIDGAGPLNSGVSPTMQATQWAPFAAVGAGVDFYFVPVFALGADLRAFTLAFPREAPPFGAQGEFATAYGTQIGLALGLTATLRPLL